MSRKKHHILTDGPGRGKKTDSALRCVVPALTAGIIAMFLLILLFAFLLSHADVPLSILHPAGLAVGCTGAAVSGFVCSRLRQEKGFFYGLGCAGALFCILLAASCLLWKDRAEPYMFVKLFSMLLCGALGGSIGVNWM